jgi:hypothetical protein
MDRRARREARSYFGPQLLELLLVGFEGAAVDNIELDPDGLEFGVFPSTVSGVSWAARKSENVRTLTDGRRPPG